jgi:hypothetical protein
MMAAGNPGSGSGSIAMRPLGNDAYEGDESGGGHHTGSGALSPLLGDESPKRIRAHSPTHRAAAALSRAVYNSPSKTSHQWALAFGALSKILLCSSESLSFSATYT